MEVIGPLLRGSVVEQYTEANLILVPLGVSLDVVCSLGGYVLLDIVRLFKILHLVFEGFCEEFGEGWDDRVRLGPKKNEA